MLNSLARIDYNALIHIEKLVIVGNDKKNQLVCQWLGILGYHYVVGSAVVW